MTAILSTLLAQFWPYVAGLAFSAIGFLAFWLRQSGKKAERAAQAEREAEARDIKDQVVNDLSSLPPDAARKELGTWSK